MKSINLVLCEQFIEILIYFEVILNVFCLLGKMKITTNLNVYYTTDKTRVNVFFFFFYLKI